jgi:hypothetical protein
MIQTALWRLKMSKRFVLSLLLSLRSVAVVLPLLCSLVQLMVMKVVVLLSSGVARIVETGR